MIFLQSSPFYVCSMVILAQPLFVGILQGTVYKTRRFITCACSLGTPTTYMYAQGLCVHVWFSQTIRHSLIPRLYDIVSFPDYTHLQNMVWLTRAHVEGSEQQIVPRVLAAWGCGWEYWICFEYLCKVFGLTRGRDGHRGRRREGSDVYAPNCETNYYMTPNVQRKQ